MTAARHARQIIQNTAHILAIELYCAARALDLRLKQRPQAQPGRGVAAAHQVIRQRVPYQAGDALWGPEVEALRELILGDEFLKDLYATNGQFTELVMNPNK
jgi:histidine ammonia-lyase